MEAPQKYKSIPANTLYNRTLIELNAAKKQKIHTIIQNFIQYLKAKHS